MALIQSRYHLRSMNRPYIYAPLLSANHIRVLVLAPAEDEGATLECSIDQVDIDDPTKEYEAISYTWGDQGKTKRLICNGTVINITPNLASALLRFRSRKDPRRLWADAICINQDNPDEKGHQVSLMAKIFRSASLVRVWLGNGDEGESQALADIAFLVKKTSPNAVQYRDTGSETFLAMTSLRTPLKKIFGMPWFGRRWIVQELVLNGNVMFHCGLSKMPWSSLHFAFQAFSKSPWANDLGPRTRRTIPEFGNLWRTWCFSDALTTRRGIYSLLQSFQDLECKDPKDKLYAIAGLADDVELKPKSPSGSCRDSLIITPTYSPAVSMDEVLQDLAFMLIRFGKVFDTLAMAGASRTMEAERCLPSWVPDVRQSGPWPVTYVLRSEFKLLAVPKHTNETLTLKIEVYFSRSDRASPGELDVVQGKLPSPPLRPASCSILDWRLLSVGDVYKTPENWIAQSVFDLYHDISNWLNLHIPPASPISDDPYLSGIYETGLSVVDVHYMLLSLLNSQFMTDNGSSGYDSFLALGKLQELCRERDKEDQWLPCLTRAFLSRTIFCGKTLREPERMTHLNSIRVHHYYYGFGPRDLHPGDKILIPSKDHVGLSALFLRPRGNGYEVLGDGIMWFHPSHDLNEMPRDIEILLL